MALSSGVVRISSLSAGLCLFASSCLAQYQPIHGPGGIMNQAGDISKELREPPLPVRDDTHAAIETHIRGLGLGEKTTSNVLRAFEWKKQHLKGNNPDVPDGFNLHNREFGLAAAAVLLYLCDNISTLYLGGVGWQPLLKDYLLKANYGLLSRPGLQKLKRVEIITGSSVYDDERQYASLEFLKYFQYFHRLPEIHSVFMEGVQEYQADKELFVPQTSNIKSIYIGHSELSSGMLGTIIRIPKALEGLTVSLGGLWATGGGTALLYLKTLGKCLLEQKDTMKVLSLDIGVAIHSGDYTYDKDGRSADGTPDFDEDRGELQHRQRPTGGLNC
ncbi:hypothetical protein QQZ08_004351 [Neonectria magnoliae]|uniref:Uncharacterized protein n=1 Tax=Neonectria magnoliae TaxID=2732573 RepID=A0ABR1I8H1_9HYPO